MRNSDTQDGVGFTVRETGWFLVAFIVFIPYPHAHTPTPQFPPAPPLYWFVFVILLLAPPLTPPPPFPPPSSPHASPFVWCDSVSRLSWYLLILFFFFSALPCEATPPPPFNAMFFLYPPLWITVSGGSQLLEQRPRLRIHETLPERRFVTNTNLCLRF